MKVSKSVLLSMVLAAMLVTSMLFIGTRSVSNSRAVKTGDYVPGQYDPWLDVNDDGMIEMMDYFYLGYGYGTSGDPAKDVSVTNWPSAFNVYVTNTWPLSIHNYLQTYNVTLAYNRPISSSSPHDYAQLTSWAKSITVAVHCQTADANLFLNTSWSIGGISVSHSNWTLSSGQRISQRLDVIGEMLLIQANTNTGNATYSLGLYLTE